MAGECVPFHMPGREITAHANVAIGGRRFCAVVGTRVNGLPRVGLPAAAARSLGVTAWDVAIGEVVGVFADHGTIVPVIAGAAIVAGAAITNDAAGAAVTAAAGNVIHGYAIDDAASGAEVPVQLRLT